MKFNRKHLLIIATAITVIMGLLVSCYYSFNDVTTAQNVVSVSWLPESATNISYYKSLLFTAYEFDISEEGFREWAKRWDIQPIQEPFKIRRYTWKTITDTLKTNKDDSKQYEQIMDSATATISDGYCYDMRQSNGGGVWVAYDRKTKRAYFHSLPR